VSGHQINRNVVPDQNRENKQMRIRKNFLQAQSGTVMMTGKITKTYPVQLISTGFHSGAHPGN
jgi:hypothetical protein